MPNFIRLNIPEWPVFPAQAGIQKGPLANYHYAQIPWIPAFAGMTKAALPISSNSAASNVVSIHLGSPSRFPTPPGKLQDDACLY